MNRTSEEGLAIIKHFETCELRAYPDPKTGGAPWTIGWGRTQGVRPGDTCTQAEADRWLAEDVAEREDIVDRHVTVPLTQGQYDAMVSIVYNVGAGSPDRDGIIRLRDGRPSTLLRRLNASNYDGAADAFLSWVSPGSNVERGLKRRRVSERAHFRGENWRQALAAHIAAGG